MYRPQLPAEAQLAQILGPGQIRNCHLSGSRQHTQRNRQIKTAALLGQVCRGQVGRDAPSRKLETGIEQCAAHAVPALANRGLGQSDNGKRRQSTGKVNLNGNRGCVGTSTGATVHKCQRHVDCSLSLSIPILGNDYCSSG